jgi:hypothetical protein
MLKGELPEQRPAPDHLDLLLLTQGLADHAHPESLDLLPRDLPVIGSVAATQVVKKMGFETVQALKPGECTTHKGLSVRATSGAPVPTVENGYLLEHASGSLYLEPHGFLDPALPPQPLDAVITPMVDLGLPALGAFVKGCSVVPQLVERFQPSTVLASTSAETCASAVPSLDFCKCKGRSPAPEQRCQTAANGSIQRQESGLCLRANDHESGNRQKLVYNSLQHFDYP